MKIHRDTQLKQYTTFGVSATADTLVEYSTVEELRAYFAEHPASEGYYMIGGGSNILFSGDYHGTLLHPTSSDIEIVGSDDESFLVRAEAGVVWDDFVLYCIEKGMYGLENLSAIPGTVGASAVQNIGAYGAEAKDFIEKVEVYDPVEDKLFSMSREECRFGYRNSVFKSRTGLIVVAVVYRLSRRFVPNLGYANLKERVSSQGDIDAMSVRETVVKVRAEKLPDPKETGSGGSFFKNPIVDKSVADKLSERYPEMPRYDVGDGVKIPAGWLIDKAGWKGFRQGDAGVYPRQALVLVNYGSATGGEVLELSKRIVADVKEKFGVELSPEIIIL